MAVAATAWLTRISKCHWFLPKCWISRHDKPANETRIASWNRGHSLVITTVISNSCAYWRIRYYSVKCNGDVTSRLMSDVSIYKPSALRAETRWPELERWRHTSHDSWQWLLLSPIIFGEYVDVDWWSHWGLRWHDVCQIAFPAPPCPKLQERNRIEETNWRRKVDMTVGIRGESYTLIETSRNIRWRHPAVIQIRWNWRSPMWPVCHVTTSSLRRLVVDG